MITGNRLYEAASQAKRASKWGSTVPGPNLALSQDLSIVRARSRRAAANNGYASGGIDKLVANMVGSGVVPKPDIDDADLKNAITTLWNRSVQELDYHEADGFYGLEWLACESMVAAGETLARFHAADPAELTVPLQLQLLEGDHLDGVPYKIYNGNPVRLGIESDRRGRKLAYHLSAEHPSDGEYYQPHRRIRVPAADMIHLFRSRRPGQLRGLPWLTSALITLIEIDEKEDADNVRRKFNSLLTGIIYEEYNEYNPPPMPEDEDDEDDDDPLDDLELTPGALIRLPGGKKIVMSEPASSDPTDVSWIKSQLRKIAQGMGVTYEQLTGDLAGVTYSSIRAGLMEFRRLCEAWTANIFVARFCRPVWHRWMDTAVAFGRLPIDPADYNRRRWYYRNATWHAPAWDWVDPLKDVSATLLKLRAGLSSRQREVQKLGADAQTIDFENKEDHDRAKDLGLVYDSDPAQVSKTGTVQPVTAKEDNDNDQ